MKIPWRKNVLFLVGGGYLTLLCVFFMMMWPGGMKPDVAYEVVKGPLMALIGGSLAISKDLIPLGVTLSRNGQTDEGGNGETPDDEKESD